MGEIAEAMLSGEMCEMCGEYLECNTCADMGIPMYCSWQCAKDRGAAKTQVCDHLPTNMPRRTKAYLAIMSVGDPIKIDEEELQKVAEGANAGELIVVKQGFINPSYLVDIQLDKERIKTWRHQTRYGHGQGEEIYNRGIEPLQTIYSAGTPIGRLIAQSTKKLEGNLPKQIEEPKEK